MVSATNPKTIDLGGLGIQREAPAAGTITPGMLLAYDSTLDVKAHDAAGGPASPMFALEYDFTGGDIDDDYAADDQVKFRVFSPGARVYAWLASGQDVAAAEFLTSNGAGLLTAASAGDIVVAQAIEAVDASGANTRIKVEVVPAQALAT